MLRKIGGQVLFEAEGTGGAGGEVSDVKPTPAEEVKDTGTGTEDAGEKQEQSREDMEKLLQSRLDKAMAKERKESAALKKEIEKLKREKMTAEELKKYDDEKRERDLAEKEAAITDRENKLYAVKVIKDMGIECSSEELSVLTGLATAGTEGTEEIESRIKGIKSIIDEAVKAECDKRFREAGRTPKGAGKATEDERNIAIKLGTRRAEADKRAKGILDYYTKRK